MSVKKSILWLLGARCSQPLITKYVSTEQYTVLVARKQCDGSRSEYAYQYQQGETQAQPGAEESAPRHALRKRQRTAKGRVKTSQVLLVQPEKALDLAWSARGN